MGAEPTAGPQRVLAVFPGSAYLTFEPSKVNREREPGTSHRHAKFTCVRIWNPDLCVHVTTHSLLKSNKEVQNRCRVSWKTLSTSTHLNSWIVLALSQLLLCSLDL